MEANEKKATIGIIGGTGFYSFFAGQEVEVEYVSHVGLKQMTKECKAVIRTGETTPYANIILQSGCIF